MDSAGKRPPVVAYIGMGANLGEPITQILGARGELAESGELREIAFSRLYRSEPMGPGDQPDYINAVMAVATSLPPRHLLDLLHRIEARHGRVRTGEHWGPRTLDLDILLYGNNLMDDPELRIPHPGIADREFVLVPLLEIAPNLSVPGLGLVRDLLSACQRRTSPLTPVDYDDDD
jgi:2-amino-4-hydroxy-6-hydroxymethyldihydropteridine diphosphokinase